MKKHLYYFSLLFILLSSCGTQKETDSTTVGDPCIGEEIKKSITIYTVEKKPVSDYIHLTGIIEENPENVLKFHSLVNGIVSNTYFSLGDQVRKGQLLAEIRSAELASLQAEKQSLEVQITAAEKHLETSTSLLQDELITQREWQESASELEILKAEREMVLSHLSLYSASTEKGVFQIKAPVSGYITEKKIRPGWQINDSEEALFIISDLNEVWVMADIYASNVRHIEAGMEVEVSTIAEPHKLIPGKIAQITRTMDSENRVLKARIPLSNTAAELQPGMLADIRVIKSEKSMALAVPEEALIFYDNRHYIVVYYDDCKIDIREVTPLSENGDLVFIQKGLEEGEKIIAGNPLLLFEKIRHQ